MLSSFLYTMLKPSKTTYPNKLFDYDCVTLYQVKKKKTSFNKVLFILATLVTKIEERFRTNIKDWNTKE